LGVLLGMLLVGCTADRPLRVAVSPWIGYETLFIARHFGWLPIDVALHESRNLGDSVDALRDGVVDAAALTLDEVLLARANGVPLAIALVFNISAGADVVLAKPGIGDLGQLRGRRVAVEPSALGPLVLSRALAEAGLTLDDVQVIDLAPDAQPQAWQADQIDAAVAYGPAVGQIEALDGQRLFDSRGMPDTIFDVLAVRRDVVDHATLPGLLEAHFRGVAHLRRSREDALYRIAERQRSSIDAVVQDLNGVALPDLARNRELLRVDGSVQRAAAEISRLMVELRLLSSPDDLNQLIDARALGRLQEPR
jgi:NitT/TauT family transport system substrate-binding protein